ncbi:hypothetical protein X777_04306 [Ooceraea biroi]|uniref:Uncharacterized protein n=1 Tax=Ooceraea biroi TaxID=2015173 RepID=A0A026WKP4_OOCBI|nr:hypothetical protein X777_04306 [Ooceraea biroi]
MGLEKREWLRNLLLDDDDDIYIETIDAHYEDIPSLNKNLLLDDDIYIETIDAHYEDIPSLNKLDVTHTLRCNKHVSHCALQNVFKMFNWCVLPTRRAIRILGRRYALTATGYKYLEIGINVGPSSCIEIAIGDNRGNELILSLETWKGLYKQRLDIQYHLYNDVRGRPISVGPLTVRFSESPVCDTKLIYLESSNVRLAMTESTFFTMFNLDRCINLMFDRLNHMVDKVDTKFTQFSNMVSTNPKNVSNAIRASDCFDENHIIDCELLALFFSKLHI